MNKLLYLTIDSENVTIHDGEANRETLATKPIIEPTTRPVVKWAGGKQWLSSVFPHFLPQTWSGKYFEVFAGGCSSFFALSPTNSVLADRNKELIIMYQAVRDNPTEVIKLLETYPYNKDFYYALREQIHSNPVKAAARLLYLNHTCWNGLYRVNQQGKFNTPFGKHSNPTICDVSRIERASVALQNATFYADDFEMPARHAQPDDLVYFDPPYITGHQNNGFISYNKHLFSWSDQERLASCAQSLSSAGVSILVSNTDHSAVVSLYKGFYRYRATRRSSIGGHVSSRGTTTEALLSNYPLFGCVSEVVR